MAGRPVFLERRRYRRRRLMDAARLLPVAGAILFAMPILWAGSATTAGGLVYIFVVWALLIVAVALLGRHLGAPAGDDGGGENKDAPR